MNEAGFSGPQTANIVGISYRQLDYWTRTDLVRSSISDAAGSGSRRVYSYSDLLEIKVVKRLLDSGIRLEVVRKVFDYITDQLGADVATASLVISGTSCVLVNSGEELWDVTQSGQGVFNTVMPLAPVKSDIDDTIVALYPEVVQESMPGFELPDGQAPSAASEA